MTTSTAEALSNLAIEVKKLTKAIHDLDLLDEEMEEKNPPSRTWKDEDDVYWLFQLVQVVAELEVILISDNNESIQWELLRLASIVRNWASFQESKMLRKKDKELYG